MTSSSRLQVGLIGLGRLGRIYAGHLGGTIPETVLAAVADPDADVAGFVAERWPQAHRYRDAEDLIRDPSVEAVVIVSPTHTHCQIAGAALAAGKPVFCEKPLSVTLHESMALQETAEKSNVLFQMGFMRRFDPGYAAARKRLEEGDLGRSVLFKSTSRDPYPPSLEYLNPASSGGIFVDMGIHDFDLALWFMGPVRAVTASGGVLVYPEIGEIGDIDTAVVNLQFENGAVGQVDLSRNGVYGYDISTEILATNGAMRIGYLRQTPIEVMTKDCVSHDTVPYFPERFADAYRLQLRDFAANVTEGRRPRIRVEDGVEALRVALAARASHESKQRVRVRDIVPEKGL